MNAKPPPATALSAFDTSPRVELIAGEVVVLGPGSIGFSMTPAAARDFHDALGASLSDLPDPRA